MSAQVRLDAVIVAASRFLPAQTSAIRSPVTGHPVCVVVLGVTCPNRFEFGGAVPQTAAYLS